MMRGGLTGLGVSPTIDRRTPKRRPGTRPKGPQALCQIEFRWIAGSGGPSAQLKHDGGGPRRCKQQRSCQRFHPAPGRRHRVIGSSEETEPPPPANVVALCRLLLLQARFALLPWRLPNPINPRAPPGITTDRRRPPHPHSRPQRATESPRRPPLPLPLNSIRTQPRAKPVSTSTRPSRPLPPLRRALRSVYSQPTVL